MTEYSLFFYGPVSTYSAVGLYDYSVKDLKSQLVCTLFVLMAIETIGEALDFSWRLTVRCAHGPCDGTERVRECVYGGELDLQTLVWTRGRDFPLARLESRLKCPRCGSRQVRLAFSVPPSSRQMRA
jgi:hypothetical protein